MHGDILDSLHVSAPSVLSSLVSDPRPGSPADMPFARAASLTGSPPRFSNTDELTLATSYNPPCRYTSSSPWPTHATTRTSATTSRRTFRSRSTHVRAAVTPSGVLQSKTFLSRAWFARSPPPPGLPSPRRRLTGSGTAPAPARGTSSSLTGDRCPRERCIFTTLSPSSPSFAWSPTCHHKLPVIIVVYVYTSCFTIPLPAIVLLWNKLVPIWIHIAIPGKIP
jgi:hypothetical protein